MLLFTVYNVNNEDLTSYLLLGSYMDLRYYWPDWTAAEATVAYAGVALPGVSDCLAVDCLGVGGAEDPPSCVALRPAAWSATGPLTSICRRSCFFRGSIFGTTIVSTPLFTSAVILSRSAFFGSLNLRTKRPRARSTTCHVSPSLTSSLTRSPLMRSVLLSSIVTSISFLPTPSHKSQAGNGHSYLFQSTNRSHALITDGEVFSKVDLKDRIESWPVRHD